MLTTYRGCCAFESACALPSGVIQGCETTYRHRINGGQSLLGIKKVAQKQEKATFESEEGG